MFHLVNLHPEFFFFSRKSLSGNWKANIGSSTVEQIEMTDRFLIKKHTFLK
jgi:hypothetical protein